MASSKRFGGANLIIVCSMDVKSKCSPVLPAKASFAPGGQMTLPIADKLNISEDEKKKYIEQYQQKELALDELHHEMELLRRNNELLLRKRNLMNRGHHVADRVNNFTVEGILPKFYTGDGTPPSSMINNFSSIASETPQYIDDLE